MTDKPTSRDLSQADEREARKSAFAAHPPNNVCGYFNVSATLRQGFEEGYKRARQQQRAEPQSSSGARADKAYEAIQQTVALNQKIQEMGLGPKPPASESYEKTLNHPKLAKLDKLANFDNYAISAPAADELPAKARVCKNCLANEEWHGPGYGRCMKFEPIPPKTPASEPVCHECLDVESRCAGHKSAPGSDEAFKSEFSELFNSSLKPCADWARDFGRRESAAEVEAWKAEASHAYAKAGEMQGRIAELEAEVVQGVAEYKDARYAYNDKKKLVGRLSERIAELEAELAKSRLALEAQERETLKKWDSQGD